MIFFGAANRDPRRWEEPDRFDITRKASGHLALGLGIHGCVGKPVARIEGQAVLGALARKVGRIELDGETQRHLNNIMRGFESLPPGGRIYLHEMLLEDTRDAPLAATSFAMNMIFFTQGKQFTGGELEKLLVEAGFEEIALTPTYGYYSLVTGRKL